MRSKQRLISLFLIFALIFPSVVSADSAPAVEEKTTYILTLDEAINMAMKNNPQLYSMDNKIKDAEKQKRDAERTQREQKGAIRIPEGFSLVPIKQGYYVEQAKIGINSAKLEKEQAIGKISYEVTQKYYTVKLAEALCESADNAYMLAQKNKETIDAQFALGMVAELDVNNASYSVNQAKAAFEKSKRDYDIAKRNLLISLQIDNPMAELILTETIDYEVFASDVDTDINKAMTTRFDVYSLESALELSKKYREVTLVLGASSAEYSSANQNVIQSEYNRNNSKKLIALGIRSSYNEVLNSSDNVLLKEENMLLREKEYNIAKIQYDIGMITNIQLTAALNAFSNAQIEYENSKLTYKLAVIKYGYEITIGL